MSEKVAGDEALTFRIDSQDVVIDFTTGCLSTTRFAGEASCANYLLFHGRSTNPTVAFADVTPLGGHLIASIARVAEQITETIEWRAHDIVIVDNSRMMHGRVGCDDSRRLVLVRMGNATIA